MDFTPLEKAALQAIFNETPEIADNLRHQLTLAVMADRKNTGDGFFLPQLRCPLY